MGWIFVDRENEGDDVRTSMRRSMRGGHSTEKHGEEYDRGYREGYRHGWDDHEAEGHRSRDGKGRYV